MLIELLVVIAIIAIPAGLLLPAPFLAGEKARQISALTVFDLRVAAKQAGDPDLMGIFLSLWKSIGPRPRRW